MQAYGHNSYKEIENLLKSGRRLDPDKVGKGIVYVACESTCGKIKKGKLILFPEAEVKEHEHTTDNEKYTTTIIENGHEKSISETCRKGQRHRAVNLSYRYYLVIDFEKWT